jgi:hypothetical protein
MKTEQVERRYLIFVSSTFEDLKTEREKVLEAILSVGVFRTVWKFSCREPGAMGVHNA